MTSFPANPTIHLLESCKSTPELLRPIHARMVKTSLLKHTFALSRLIALYAKFSGGLGFARSLLSRSDNANAFMYFNVIRGFAESDESFQALVLYKEMVLRLEGFSGVEFSIPAVLSVCGELMAVEEGRQVHGQIVKNGFLHCDMFVMNGLVRMYSEIGEIGAARMLFDIMPERDLISWNSMIKGYLRVGQIESARNLFDEMPERDLVACNALIHGYGECGDFESAREVFDMVEVKDVVTWTSMISANVMCGFPARALELFREMLNVGIRADVPAIVAVLAAIADVGLVEEGKWMHGYIRANGISLSTGFIGSALIDMYANCGLIEEAYQVFRVVSFRMNVGDWNSMISALAVHGIGQEAIAIFHDMQMMGVKPDDITFLALLAACSHSGLVEEGQFYFNYMTDKFNIPPSVQHYGCLVDLYSRAGLFEEAFEIIENMPMKADDLAWKAILNASLSSGKSEIGINAALQVMELAPGDSSPYVLMSNLYAKAGRWEEVAKLRLIMKLKGVKKFPGCSSIEIGGDLLEFVVGREVNGSLGT